MSATFASQEWADSLAVHLRDDARVRTDAVTWVFGPLLLIADADAEHGFDAAAVRIDLHEGDVRAVTVVDVADEARTPFALGGALARWRSIFAGDINAVDAIVQSKLRARGDLPTLARHRSLLDGIARAGAALETVWQDEQDPIVATN